MTRSSEAFRAGTRGSRLARLQTRGALDAISSALGGLEFELLTFSSPGDRDRVTDLRESPPDFFTRELDRALLEGGIDLAVHSAKDLPAPMPEGLDWFWLPWREDPRDAIILPRGRSLSSLPPEPRIGVSSGRREEWCRGRFPGCRALTLRGDIEDRLAKLDSGDYDLIVMAGAALLRLGLEGRVSEWISLDELAPPEGQGYLAVTFKAGNPRLQRLRSAFVKTVVFAGAGPGGSDNCTLGCARALQRAEVCLYDALVDPALLDFLPPKAKRIDVGKRSGAHGMGQEDISRLIAEEARKGFRVVRLKGGDPGIFGRLAEEIETLDSLGFPYRVIPGLSSLAAATTGTGILLTRRGISKGFCALTPREAGGGAASVGKEARSSLPLVLFMALERLDEVSAELLGEGMAPERPAALVFDAGGTKELILRASLGEIAAAAKAAARTDGAGRPGLLIVGDVARFGYRDDWGALGGRRILITCSEALQEKTAAAVQDLGGRPLPFPLIRLKPGPEARKAVASAPEYDWLVLSSPSAARIFVAEARESGLDLRRLPRILAAGSGTAEELRHFGLWPDLVPESDFGVRGMAEAASGRLAGAKVLRLRSDKAGGALAAELRERGALVDEAVLYVNEALEGGELPPFDAAFFASSSAVEAFVELWGTGPLADKTIVAIGGPTEASLSEALAAARGAALGEGGLAATVVPGEATAEAAIARLAGYFVQRAISKEGNR
jgi:uroporphyrinogen III methyltransferase / synthase